MYPLVSFGLETSMNLPNRAVPTLTDHHAAHRIIDRHRAVCSCGEPLTVEPMQTIDDARDAHVAATWQQALDNAGAETRVEYGIEWNAGDGAVVIDIEDFAFSPAVLRKRAVVTMPWQPAEEVEA